MAQTGILLDFAALVDGGGTVEHKWEVVIGRHAPGKRVSAQTRLDALVTLDIVGC